MVNRPINLTNTKGLSYNINNRIIDYWNLYDIYKEKEDLYNVLVHCYHVFQDDLNEMFTRLDRTKLDYDTYRVLLETSQKQLALLGNTEDTDIEQLRKYIEYLVGLYNNLRMVYLLKLEIRKLN